MITGLWNIFPNRMFKKQQSPTRWGFVYKKMLMYYIKSSANAKNVTLNGNTIEQYPPPTAYTPKNATTDNKNKIQYKPVDFFLVVTIKNFLQIY